MARNMANEFSYVRCLSRSCAPTRLNTSTVNYEYVAGAILFFKQTTWLQHMSAHSAGYSCYYCSQHFTPAQQMVAQLHAKRRSFWRVPYIIACCNML